MDTTMLSDINTGLKTKDPYWGVLETGDSEKDYQLCAGELILPKPRFTFEDNKIQYHQPDISSVSCTVMSSIGAASALMGVRWSEKQCKEVWAEAIRLGAREGWGWITQKAWDLVRKYALKFYGETLLGFQCVFGSDEFFDALEQGYGVIVSFSGNKNFNIDRSDGILDLVNLSGESTYGHAVYMIKGSKPKTYTVIVDSYFKSRGANNLYNVPKANIKTLHANGVFSHYGYLYCIKQDYDNMNTYKEIPLWAAKSAAKAKAKGVIQDWRNPDEIVGTEKLEWILRNMGALTTGEKSVTLARFAVALDRLGMLD